MGASGALAGRAVNQEAAARAPAPAESVPEAMSLTEALTELNSAINELLQKMHDSYPEMGEISILWLLGYDVSLHDTLLLLQTALNGFEGLLPPQHVPSSACSKWKYLSRYFLPALAYDSNVFYTGQACTT